MPGGDIMQMLQASWPLLLMLVIFYFLLYRPQKREQKKRAEMLSSLKKGDKVVTVGGIIGTIVALSERIITVKVAEKVELEFTRESVNRKNVVPAEESK